MSVYNHQQPLYFQSYIIHNRPELLDQYEWTDFVYEPVEDQQALADMHKQAQVIADDLKANESQLLLGENGIQANQEIIALIAYMQKLGADIEIVQSSNLTPKP